MPNAWWDKSSRRWHCKLPGEPYEVFETPTHWRPLPSPPGSAPPRSIRDEALEALELYDRAYTGMAADSFDGIEERYVLMLQEAHNRGKYAIRNLKEGGK